MASARNTVSNDSPRLNAALKAQPGYANQDDFTVEEVTLGNNRSVMFNEPVEIEIKEP